MRVLCPCREQQALRELAEENLVFTSYVRMLQYVGAWQGSGGRGQLTRPAPVPVPASLGLRLLLWAGRRTGACVRATAACAQPCCWAPAGALER